MRTRFGFFVASVLSVFVWTFEAHAQDEPGMAYEYELVEGVLVTRQGEKVTSTLELVCGTQAKLLSAGGDYFVACPDVLLQISRVDPGSPTISGKLPMRGVARSVELANDGTLRLWVSTSSTTAVPIELARHPLEKPEHQIKNSDLNEDGAPQKASTSGQPVGKVIRVERGEVFTDLGKTDGIDIGDMLVFYTEERDAAQIYQVPLFTARVTSISEQSSKVLADLNVRLPEGALVRRIEPRAEPRATPPARPAGVTEFSVHARPFLGTETLGIGAMVDAQLVHHFHAPVAIGVDITPLVAARNRDLNIGGFGISGLAFFDGELFGFGFGLGTHASSPNNNISAQRTVHLAQFMRLGARDGFHVRSTLRFYPGAEELEFHAAHVHVQYPLRSGRTWLVARGGGGYVANHFYMEGGVRQLLWGNGLEESFFAAITVGGSLVSRIKVVDESRFGEPMSGPHVGLAAEWRF